MLVLTRRENEKIVIPGLGVTITLVKILDGKVRLGIDAPREQGVWRAEIMPSEGGETRKGGAE